jgi:hypothetical protein
MVSWILHEGNPRVRHSILPGSTTSHCKDSTRTHHLDRQVESLSQPWRQHQSTQAASTAILMQLTEQEGTKSDIHGYAQHLSHSVCSATQEGITLTSFYKTLILRVLRPLDNCALRETLLPYRIVSELDKTSPHFQWTKEHIHAALTIFTILAKPSMLNLDKEHLTTYSSRGLSMA